MNNDLCSNGAQIKIIMPAHMSRTKLDCKRRILCRARGRDIAPPDWPRISLKSAGGGTLGKNALEMCRKSRIAHTVKISQGEANETGAWKHCGHAKDGVGVSWHFLPCEQTSRCHLNHRVIILFPATSPIDPICTFYYGKPCK